MQKKLKNIIEIAKDLAIQRGGKCISTEYKNNKNNLLWECGKCNSKWTARFDRVKSGTWCPRCRRSHGEKIICEYLDKEKVNFCLKQGIRLLRISYNTKNIQGILDFAIDSDIPLIITDKEKYSHIISDMNCENYIIMLNGGR